MIRLALYYSIASFFISTVLVAWVYFSPSQQLVNSSFLYGVGFFVTSGVLLLLFSIKVIRQGNERRKYLIVLSALFINAIVTVGYAIIWDYALGTTLIKIINQSGYAVKDAGIYGCFGQSWGTLANGESKTVRFPAASGCAFMVTYNLNGDTKLEALPSKSFTKNVYYLGAHIDNEQ
jgi:hypothetical protein